MVPRLEMSENMIKLAGVAQYLNYCAWQHKIAFENGMDDSATRDWSSGLHYIDHFANSLEAEERKKYEPICEALMESFLEETKSHKRLPGVTPFDKSITAPFSQ